MTEPNGAAARLDELFRGQTRLEARFEAVTTKLDQVLALGLEARFSAIERDISDLRDSRKTTVRTIFGVVGAALFAAFMAIATRGGI